MSKSFKEKKTRDLDFDDNRHKNHYTKHGKKNEKAIHNALRARDINTLIKYSEEMN